MVSGSRSRAIRLVPENSLSIPPNIPSSSRFISPCPAVRVIAVPSSRPSPRGSSIRVRYGARSADGEVPSARRIASGTVSAAIHSRASIAATSTARAREARTASADAAAIRSSSGPSSWARYCAASETRTPGRIRARSAATAAASCPGASVAPSTYHWISSPSLGSCASAVRPP